MKRNFVELANVLRYKFPHLRVVGDNYPPGPEREFGMQIVLYCQLFVVTFLLFGARLLSLLGFAEPPSWFTSLSENKGAILLAAFFIGNAINSNLAQTGAFEVGTNTDSVKTVVSSMESWVREGIVKGGALGLPTTARSNTLSLHSCA
eukprot:TRINITY_DN1922_c0_g1_i1.p1 TRINITY_DN1922_c0_g1~~TRINITY_DN1922_c0_g1_i1.p1  ORF type:complete len:148 (-),score=10.99 TRINITY_DN1922_c0_g1_i1:525-968(-)